MKGLTEKQKNIIGFISNFMKNTDMAPTVYEIAEHFGIKTSTVFAHIKALQKKGYISRTSKARSLSLEKEKTKRARISSRVHSIPVLEMISHAAEKQQGASSPQIHGKEKKLLHDALFCDRKLLGKECRNENLFAFQVEGCSMQDLGIYDGDILIVRSFPVDISSGDIVLTELDGESVLRSCYCLDADQIELRAGNTSDKPRVCKKSEFFPKGVVIGLHRCM